jgi:flavodoxin
MRYNTFHQKDDRAMNLKTQKSRRQFLKGAAVTVGAFVLVSCAPGRAAPDLPESLQNAPAPGAANPAKDLKVLVVYDTVYGNTAKIADAMIEGLGGAEGSKVLKVSDAVLSDLEQIDLLLVGSPTHAGTYIEPVKAFLDQIPDGGLAGKPVAAFDTSFSKETQKGFMRVLISVMGFAAPKIGEVLTSRGGALLDAQSFIVLDTEGPLQEGELDRARAWAAGLPAKMP